MAKILDVFEAAESARRENLSMPSVGFGSRFATLNQMGNTRLDKDFVNEKFFQFLVENPGSHIFELGPAFGHTCFEAYKQISLFGTYTALDMDENHLKILARSIYENFPDKFSTLRLVTGQFPNHDVIDLLESNKFDVILARHVFHFMTEPQFKTAIEKCHKLLKPGGHLLAVIMTPYLSITKPEIIDKFDDDVERFKELIKHQKPDLNLDQTKLPGFYAKYRETLNISKFVEKGIVSFDQAAITKGHMMKVGKEIVKFLLDRLDFEIVFLEYVTLDSEIWRLDGRETVAVIARKK